MAKPRRKGSSKDGWELRIWMGRTPEGRARVKSVMFHGTKSQAFAEQARLEVEARGHLQRERELEPEMIPDVWGPEATINQAFAAYFESPKWTGCAPSTQLRYENIYKTHIQETIGKRTIASLNSLDIERFLLAMKEGSAGRPPQSRSSVNQAKVILSNACQIARKGSNGYLRNPVKEADLPTWRPEEVSEPKVAADIAEVAQLFNACDDPAFLAYLRVVAATGMRRGEACGLTWADWDESDDTVTIIQGVTASKGGAIARAPKSKKSKRRICIGADASSAVASVRAQLEELAKLDPSLAPRPEHFIFSREVPGIRPPYPDNMSTKFAALRKKAGLREDLTLHSLRHLQSTLIDGVVSDTQVLMRLGWATKSMQRHYTDAVNEEDRKAASHVESELRRAMQSASNDSAC